LLQVTIDCIADIRRPTISRYGVANSDEFFRSSSELDWFFVVIMALELNCYLISRIKKCLLSLENLLHTIHDYTKVCSKN